MAILRKNKYKNGPSGASDFSSLKTKMHGFYDSRIQKSKRLFSSDYIFLYDMDAEVEDMEDSEIGINKAYHRVHDPSWCDEAKDELWTYPSEELTEDEFSDIINGNMDLNDILDLLGEDDV